MNGLAWTEAEDEAVRRLWPRGSKADILAALPDRTWRSIQLRASMMEVRRSVASTMTRPVPVGGGQVREDPDVPMARTRRCAWALCIERFVPVNAHQRWCSGQCQEQGRQHPDGVLSLEDQLREEGTSDPTANHMELAKRAFAQKNQLARKLASVETIQQYLGHELLRALDADPARLPAPVPRPDRDVGSDRIPMLVISDWQCGKFDRGSGVEVMLARVGRIRDAWSAIITREREGGHAVNEVVICLVGDLVENCAMFAGQRGTLDRWQDHHLLIRQVMTVTDCLVELVRATAEMVPLVRVVSVGGNHGRTGTKADPADARDNLDTLCAEMASRMMAATPHVTWEIADDWYGVTHVYDWPVVLTHGDAWQGDLPQVETLLPRWLASDRFGVRPEVVLLGHRHSFRAMEVNGILVVQNGTIDAGSDWFVKRTGKASEPSQTVIVWSEELGVESLWPVYFREQ